MPCASRLPLRRFIREHRQELTDCIEAMTSGKRKAHFLAYG